MLSLLSLQLIGPHRFNSCVAALAMAASAFVVGLPESTHLVTKQLAFGQLVNVFVSTVVDGGRTGVAVHPVHVVCSTAFGGVAAVLAMLLPFPRLAHYEVILYFLSSNHPIQLENCYNPSKLHNISFFGIIRFT